MNRFEFSIPRAAFGAAAVAMTALTLAVAVVVPATLATADHPARSVAKAAVVAPAGAEAAASRLRIEVVGTRERTVASDAPCDAAPNPGHQV